MSVMACLLLCAGQAASATAQQPRRITKDEVGWIYARARFTKEFRQFIAREGVLVTPAALDRHEVPSDTLPTWIMALAARGLPALADPPWAGEVHSWELITSSGRHKQWSLFGATKMAYVGNDHFTAMDTMATPQIRAKMQSAFGEPTLTIVEAIAEPSPAEYIQFEYWFVVNDSIPVIVMDAHGPYDHGIVLAGDYRYREYLYVLRQSLLGRVMREEPYEAYVDYFYEDIKDQWYRTGYDGMDFFVQPVGQLDLAYGRPTLSEKEAMTSH